MLSSLPCHLPARSVQAGLPAAGGDKGEVYSPLKKN
ncbi:hypothetical protein B879_02128 [Cecembia lonarensis LW9]|uniref:Uncharacterized protein n=1 Tax=Cecembia lonarensis (strain CCUG 58316 / KCTC 22772 / LW9) TaxID=1225176 RepID=K1LAP4_CECL9|nr:hypothetical protein B879_02128 [Cecembia lonarensis LW9]